MKKPLTISDQGLHIHPIGGVDGTRTRDPRRDSTGHEPSNHAGLRLIYIPKT